MKERKNIFYCAQDNGRGKRDRITDKKRRKKIEKGGEKSSTQKND
jgi:hypothetical protein